MKYIPITSTKTNDVDLVYENFIKFYNLIRSNHVLKSRTIKFYLDPTYFLKSWFDHREGCYFMSKWAVSMSSE
jgi:hypothetical protein